jgi:imidazoleglycerol phosphate synthase cyclase subunit
VIKPRLIVCLLVKGGLIVRSELFETHQAIGNPVDTVHRLSNWSVDELMILDIGEDGIQDMRRDDLRVKYTDMTFSSLLRQISEVCIMPLSVGGRITTLDHISERLKSGADKVVINSAAVENPNFIKEAAQKFGSQCITISIDVKLNDKGKYEVFIDRGNVATGLDPVEHAQNVEALGAGEIFLNSIDRDGVATGYDLELSKMVTDAVKIPMILCGGVGKNEHFVEGVTKGGAQAVAAANIFHFFEQSYIKAKQTCVDAGLNMRPHKVSSDWFKREPQFKHSENIKRYNYRMNLASQPLPKNTTLKDQSVRWCKKCLYPWISATPMEFNADGVCMGCVQSQISKDMSLIDWDARKEHLIDLIESTRCRDGSRHDCIVPVSGGKDSHFQAHYIKNVLGYNPLLVTYYGNNFTEVGHRNLYRMKESLGLDHVIYYPNVDTVKKLNRLGLILLGDMNWHNHVGIATVPMKVAAERGIPLVIWGEHGYADLCGQYSMNDFVEWTYRNRLEHYSRGFDWNYFVGLEGLKSIDLDMWKYPSDDAIHELNLRGLYLSNFTRWEANSHTELVTQKYGFESSMVEFDRTYRKMSNLDDMHENGAHDYLRYIKFGYGRCTDHVSKDIRGGLMSRGQGIGLVEKYDHVRPSDIKRWLNYTGMDEKTFDSIVDTWRDPRVWFRKDGQWCKKNVRDEGN